MWFEANMQFKLVLLSNLILLSLIVACAPSTPAQSVPTATALPANTPVSISTALPLSTQTHIPPPTPTETSTRVPPTPTETKTPQPIDITATGAPLPEGAIYQIVPEPKNKYINFPTNMSGPNRNLYTIFQRVVLSSSGSKIIYVNYYKKDTDTFFPSLPIIISSHTKTFVGSPGFVDTESLVPGLILQISLPPAEYDRAIQGNTAIFPTNYRLNSARFAEKDIFEQSAPAK